MIIASVYNSFLLLSPCGVECKLQEEMALAPLVSPGFPAWPSPWQILNKYPLNQLTVNFENNFSKILNIPSLF